MEEDSEYFSEDVVWYSFRNLETLEFIVDFHPKDEEDEMMFKMWLEEALEDLKVCALVIQKNFTRAQERETSH